MKLIVLVALLALFAYARHPVNHEIVEEIKSSTNLWWPVEPEENIFKYHTEEKIQSMLGTRMDQEKDIQIANDLGISDYDVESNEAVPEHFDSREKWGECPFEIKNQGGCGSCWAFGAVESLEDRLCIASEGKIIVDLSEQNVVSCDWSDFGCSGGFPLNAMSYLSLIGTPSEECIPYTSGHSGSGWGCTYKCDDETVSNKRYKCKYPWVHFTNSGIKTEIFKRGPIETSFLVYEDFMNYKGGIYHHTTGKYLGGHAVKIVGWGKEDSIKYWIVANSWSKTWGEKGYFRIQEGSCFFAAAGYSCSPWI